MGSPGPDETITWPSPAIAAAPVNSSIDRLDHGRFRIGRKPFLQASRERFALQAGCEDVPDANLKVGSSCAGRLREFSAAGCEDMR